MKIYTKTGDEGLTGLFGGGRVPKDHARVEAYGDVDELNAFLGVARAAEHMPKSLFQFSAICSASGRCSPRPTRKRCSSISPRLASATIAELELAIDACDRELEPLKAFILPGGAPKAAALHVARTVCRRAERRVIHLQREVEIPQIVVVYLNRLSDLLFTLARLANARAGAGEVTW